MKRYNINNLKPNLQQKYHLLMLLGLTLIIAKPVHASPLVFENTLAAKLEQTLATKNNVNLTVSPEQCVAMQQGQNCYVAIELNWRAELAGNYCLYSSSEQQPLQCWNNRDNGKVKKDFTTKTNLIFFLKKQDGQQNIATAKVKMSWVHKKKGKPRKSWRMF
ncbi:MAG: DUF3019 domain-containing protein [Colwellia sp.]|nr:DUF3019 domain-containing protein [Colwellia sp.]